MSRAALPKQNTAVLRRSLCRHLLTFRAPGTEPKAWSVPTTRRHARKQAERAGK